MKLRVACRGYGRDCSSLVGISFRSSLLSRQRKPHSPFAQLGGAAQGQGSKNYHRVDGSFIHSWMPRRQTEEIASGPREAASFPSIRVVIREDSEGGGWMKTSELKIKLWEGLSQAQPPSPQHARVSAALL